MVPKNTNVKVNPSPFYLQYSGTKWVKFYSGLFKHESGITVLR